MVVKFRCLFACCTWFNFIRLFASLYCKGESTMKAFITWASDSLQSDNTREIELTTIDDLKVFYKKEKMIDDNVMGLIVNFCNSPESIEIEVYNDYVE